MSIRKTNDSKLVESNMLDVREPAWGDNLDPDSKNYIYQRSKSYRNASGPIKNMKGRRELANALRWKNKLATGDYTQKELGDALAAETKDLEKIKKKLGRDFKPEELTEMLLYLNDELKKFGIDLRPDLMSKKDYLEAQKIIAGLFDEDIEEEDFEESTKKVREALDDRLVNSYTVIICDNERAANRGFGHDTFHNVSIKAVDDRDAMKQAWIAQNAVNEGFYEGSFDEATIEDTLEFLEEDYYGSKEELDEVLNCSVEEFADIFDNVDPGFGDAIVFRVVCDTTGKTIYDGGLEEEDWEEDDEDEEDWEDEEDEEDFEESVKKEKMHEARNPYRIYMCDNATYQRSADFDNYYVIVPSSDVEYEVFLEALKRHVTQNCTGSIEEVNAEWDEWMKDPDEFEYWSEIIEDAESIKEFIEEDDIGGGGAFVFGIKKGDDLVLDANFDEEMLVWKTQKAIEEREDLEESTCEPSEKITESEEVLYIIYGVNSRGERKDKPLAEFSSLDRAIDYSKNILKGKCAIVERTWDEEESDYVEEEVWSSMKESKTFKKLQRVREAAAANYEIYICDGNGAASRGMEVDSFEVVSMSFKSDAEAYLYGYLACEAMEEGYFDEADCSLDDLIEQYNEEHTPHWEVPREDEDEEYEVEVGESPEIEKYLKDAHEAKELLYGQDPGFGAPFVYGVKKNGTLIYDLDFEEIEKDRLYLEEEFEEF